MFGLSSSILRYMYIVSSGNIYAYKDNIKTDIKTGREGVCCTDNAQNMSVQWNQRDSLFIQFIHSKPGAANWHNTQAIYQMPFV
jgi:hypothetical protein